MKNLSMKPDVVTTKLVGCLSGFLLSFNALAAGQVSTVVFSEQAATPFTYTADGRDYEWGRGNNQLIDGFIAQGRRFDYALAANEVVVQRDDIAGVTTGEPCGIFVERLQVTDRSLSFAADFPSDGSASGNCDLESLLASRIVNRGLLDTFSNTAPYAKNIERLDYLYYYGALAPVTPDHMSLAGHLVAEKRGNNAVKIAAIVSLDVFGQPDGYGPLVLVAAAGCSDPDICYGATDLFHSYSFLQNELNAPHTFPVETDRSQEAVNMAFVSTDDLGLTPGQRYFGVSLFADDVDAGVHVLTDPSTFPDDTSDDYIVLGDDADIYGGLTGYFLAEDMGVVAGQLFLDVDQDGMSDADEAGISDISLALHRDVNGDGLLDIDVDNQLGDTLISDIDGKFFIPGITDGNYLLVLDDTDPQIPQGLELTPGINPYPVTVAGATSNPVYYSFGTVSESGNGAPGGSAGTGTDDGAGDGSNGGAGDGTDDGTGDVNDDGAGDGTDGGDGSNGGAGDGTDGGAGDGSNGGAGDGTDGGADDGSDGGAGDGTDGGAGDGSDGGAGDGTDGGAGDGSDGGAGDGTDGGAGDVNDDGAGDGTDGGAGDGSDGGAGDGTDDGAGDGSDGGDPGADNDGNDPMADDATMAVADEFHIIRGQSATLDVLANDVDGAGNGLTLLSVSESANATITTTTDNQILYIPNYGYYSLEGEPDTFFYTMEDGDGTTRTGNVSINVLRSDLNNNEIDDFVECDCTDISLVTGVNGSGVGKLSGFGALALLMLCLSRVLRRTATRLPSKAWGGR